MEPADAARGDVGGNVIHRSGLRRRGLFNDEARGPVAVDAVQAGEGNFVLLSYGSSARMTDETKNAPIDAVIIAIIDDVQLTRAVPVGDRAVKASAKS